MSTRPYGGVGAIESSVLEKLFDSVPSRLNEGIKMKGYETHY